MAVRAGAFPGTSAHPKLNLIKNLAETMSESKPQILVLDDDALALELYARELGSDYAVVTTGSIEETRRYLANSTFDVLIIEPAVNADEGWSLLEKIRTTQNHPRIILCSVEDERKKGFELGADVFLVKPVLPEALHTRLDQVLARTIAPAAQPLDTR